MSNILIFDTETTGFPPKNTNYDSPSWDSCRLVQIAWELWHLSECGIKSLIKSECYTIKPDGFTIPEKVSIIHGIYQENAINNGVPLKLVIDRLKEILPTINLIVSHNIDFDNKVVVSELYRAKEFDIYKKWRQIDKKCTMLMGTKKGEKWPKLSELYHRLFDRDPETKLHSADGDTFLCSQIYFKLFEQEKNK
jgi:DNA polymerase III epsilon subunit-like protein